MIRLPLLDRLRRVTPRLPARTGTHYNFFANLEETWILHYFAKAILSQATVTYNPVHHHEWSRIKDEAPFREAAGGFFIHYALYRDYLKKSPPRRDVVFFTHFWPMSAKPAEAETERREMLACLEPASLIISMSTHWRTRLVEWGVPERKIVVELVGSDGERYTPGTPRTSPRLTVGLVSGYKENKNEPFIREAVKRHPEFDWVLLGRHWDRTTLLQDLAGLPHFKYLDLSEADYAKWPDVYRGFDILVSPSLTEGGPVPLLEAMLTGVWPIASRTGHAEDVIRDGENGFIYDIDDAAAFDRALARSAGLARVRREAVRESVLPLTWERFGRGVDARMKKEIA